MNRYAEYIRKSRADDPHESLEETLQKHKEILAKLVLEKGYVVRQEDVYEEVVSGESLYSRPQMLKLLEAVEAGKYAGVLCVDIQRLGRGSMTDQGVILDAFKSSGTKIITPTREYDLTNETDETYTEFETFMSRQEYKLIRRRLQRGLRSTIEAGGYIANAPFGYEKCKVGKTPSLRIYEPEAKFVRLAYDLYCQGVGCQHIADRLNAEGAKPHRGDQFNRNSVRFMLTNPVYIGKIVWDRKKHIRKGAKGNAKHITLYTPKDQWTVTQGLHPPLITQDKWDQVQEIFAKRYRTPSYTGVIENPLAGLMICGNCGKHMQRAAHMRGGPFLLCTNRGCIPMSKLPLVEEQALLGISKKLEELRYKADGTQDAEADTSKQEKAAIQAQIETARRQDAKLHDLLEQGVYDIDTFLQRHGVLVDRIKHYEEVLSSIRPTKQLDTDAMADRVEYVLSAYHGATPEERNHLLKSVVEKIVYHKEKGAKPADFTLDVYLLPIYL